jgi:glutathione S-transferase
MSALIREPRSRTMTDRPILYTFRRCPYAMRARMALIVSGMQCDVREVVLRDKPFELIAVSPKGTVPVLITEDQVIDESRDIMAWALARNDPDHWLAGVDEDLITINDGAFKQALDHYKYPHRYALVDGLAYREDAALFVARIEQILANHRHLTSDRCTLTDIALFPFIRQFAATDAAWFDSQPFAHTRRWLTTLESSPLFTAAMVRFPKWRSGDEVTTLF